MKHPGKLYLIPSPLAPETTQVIPEHTKLIIKELNYYLVENVRTARRYISSLKLGVSIESLHFELYDKRTSFEEIIDLLTPISSGEDGGIMSEAGCPGIADPGALAVQAAHQLKIPVVPLVGPSSILMALIASGFKGQSFTFHGYLPIDKQERKKKIKSLESMALKSGHCQIFMETPYRNESLFQSLKEVCHPNTRLCVAAGMTSSLEAIQTLSINTWKKTTIKIHKIPCIFIIGT